MKVPPGPLKQQQVSEASTCTLKMSGMCSCLRLAEGKSSVVKALADDFDTPRAIGAVMNLVHHGNRQLQPVSKVTHCDS